MQTVRQRVAARVKLALEAETKALRAVERSTATPHAPPLEAEEAPQEVAQPQGGYLLSPLTVILEEKRYSTETASPLAGNSPELLGKPQLGDWWALPIVHCLYRAAGGTFFERFYRRLSVLTETEAMELYSQLEHKRPFAEAFPDVEVEEA